CRGVAEVRLAPDRRQRVTARHRATRAELPGRDRNDPARPGDRRSRGQIETSHPGLVPAAVRNRLGSLARRAGRCGLPRSCEAQCEDVNELGLTPFLLLSAFLFACGVTCVAIKRNAVGILMGVELILNAANVNLVAFARFNTAFRLEGQVFALMV